MNDIRYEIYIAGSAEAIWQALTADEAVAKLYWGSRLISSFAAGSAYRYDGPDGKGNTVTHVEGEILACEPSALLSMTHRAGAVWRTGPKVYSSRITYKMEPLGFATKLTVTHDQWEEGDPGHAHNLQGWPLLCSSLKSYVETGKALEIPLP